MDMAWPKLAASVEVTRYNLIRLNSALPTIRAF